MLTPVEARGELRPALRERVEASSEDDVLADASSRLLGGGLDNVRPSAGT
jgi:hypothetical protein